jgi:hypothetical protein
MEKNTERGDKRKERRVESVENNGRGSIHDTSAMLDIVP